MQQKGEYIPKAIRDWEKLNREWGCVITGENQPIELHHVIGYKQKHNKQWIGPWFVITLAYRLHSNNSQHSLNVTYHWKAFVKEYGPQRELFKTRCDQMVEQGITLPFDDDIMNAILATKY